MVEIVQYCLFNRQKVWGKCGIITNVNFDINRLPVFFSLFVLVPISGSPTPTETEYGLQPLAGHSLSWECEKKSITSPNGRYNTNVMTAKIWTPEDPREIKYQQQHDINSNELETLIDAHAEYKML